MSTRHFVDIAPLASADLRRILDEAHARKKARAGRPKAARDSDAPLDGHALAMIFQKNSTRTRVSFDIGMRQLGGQSLVMTSAETQLGRGESIADTARVLERMVDIVMIRANTHQDLLDYAEASAIPLINGLSDFSHPCQILADLMTVEERLGSVKGKTIAWIGDGNNVCASFLHAAPHFGFSMKIATPAEYAPRTQEVEAARAAGASIAMSRSADEAAEGADVVVTDTWVSMGDTDMEARMAAFPPYQVGDALMARAAKNAVFLHCLPAHRNEEVTDSVMDGPQSAIWDEAENRIHAQKAVLLWCLGKI